MTKSEALARHYFDLSNNGQLREIETLFSDSSTYSSPRAGVLLGANAIMAMQADFFARFKSLGWAIHEVTETQPGVVCFDFTFSGETLNGEHIESMGLETVVIHNERIQHVDIRDKQ